MVGRATDESDNQITPETELQVEPGWTVMMNRLAPEMQLGLDRIAIILSREARERYEANHD